MVANIIGTQLAIGVAVFWTKNCRTELTAELTYYGMFESLYFILF
jgi:hypothetical protein